MAADAGGWTRGLPARDGVYVVRSPDTGERVLFIDPVLRSDGSVFRWDGYVGREEATRGSSYAKALMRRLCVSDDAGYEHIGPLPGPGGAGL